VHAIAAHATQHRLTEPGSSAGGLTARAVVAAPSAGAAAVAAAAAAAAAAAGGREQLQKRRPGAAADARGRGAHQPGHGAGALLPEMVLLVGPLTLPPRLPRSGLRLLPALPPLLLLPPRRGDGRRRAHRRPRAGAAAGRRGRRIQGGARARRVWRRVPGGRRRLCPVVRGRQRGRGGRARVAIARRPSVGAALRRLGGAQPRSLPLSLLLVLPGLLLLLLLLLGSRRGAPPRSKAPRALRRTPWATATQAVHKAPPDRTCCNPSNPGMQGRPPCYGMG
jgi:hypothetical protein